MCLMRKQQEAISHRFRDGGKLPYIICSKMHDATKLETSISEAGIGTLTPRIGNQCGHRWPPKCETL